MAGNSRLRAARRAKRDEFYTQLCDVENELRYYQHHFKGKTILCNCDDPHESNFFKYFVLHFNALGLSKLIATSYVDSPSAGRPYRAEVTRVRNVTSDTFDVSEIFRQSGNKLTVLAGDGDFRSAECLELLNDADVVVTNPPFSLFREYVTTLVEREKRFLIIGNINAITYKEIFPLLKEGKMWLGVTCFNAGVYFRVPESFTYAPSYRFDRVRDGVKVNRVPGTCWYTNLDIATRHEALQLVKSYAARPDKYPHYDNYDAINVDRVIDIPSDYYEAMGVPITFMDRYNPDQFELLGIMNTGEANVGIRHSDAPHGRPLVKGKEKYLRILIRRRGRAS